MKPTVMICKMIIISALLQGTSAPGMAYRPPIVVGLKFNKIDHNYGCNEPVSITITVKNTAANSIRINRDVLHNARFFLHMRIIDPAGRLLIPRVDAPRDGSPHVPPLPFVEGPIPEKLVMAAPCGELPPGRPIKEETRNLGDYYSFEQSGKYQARVQLSIMEFNKEGVCNPKDYRWLGVIESRNQEFFLDDRLPVRIRPNIWRLDWKHKDPGRNVQVEIPIPLGNTTKDFRNRIQLVNMGNLEANAEKYPRMLKAGFRGKECITRLKNVRSGYSYRVVISGNYVDGKHFCGSQRITIR